MIVLLLTLATTTYTEQLRYSNEWVVRFQGGVAAAKRLSRSMGYNYAGQVQFYCVDVFSMRV